MPRVQLFGVIVVLTLLPVLMHCGDASFGGDAADAADAATDGTSPNESSISDASAVDAPIVSSDSATAVSPCAADAAHWICDDFDRAGSLTDFPYWSATNVSDAGASLLVGPPGPPKLPSPPNALLVETAADTQAVVFKTDTIFASGLSCDFDIRIDQDGENYLSNIALLSLYTASTYYRVNASIGPSGSGDGFADYVGFADGGTFISPEEGFTLPRHQWTHIRLQASLGAAGEVAIFVDGVDRHFTTTIDLTGIGMPTSASIQLGSSTGDGSGASWKIAYDNAYCDLIP